MKAISVCLNNWKPWGQVLLEGLQTLQPLRSWNIPALGFYDLLKMVGKIGVGYLASC